MCSRRLSGVEIIVTRLMISVKRFEIYFYGGFSSRATASAALS